MEEEQYNNAPDMPFGNSNDKASIIERINPDEIVELIRMRLMGKMRDEQTGKWVTNKNLKDNAISEIGAWDISNLILSVSNANTSLSKLDDKTIRKRAYSLMEKGVYMMLCNWREYKITNTAQLGYVAEIVFSIAFITLKWTTLKELENELLQCIRRVETLMKWDQLNLVKKCLDKGGMKNKWR